MAYQSISPYDGNLRKTFEGMSDVELESALVTANRCFESWGLCTFAQRATVVARAAAIMRERIDELARLATLEMGKLIDKACGEMLLNADILDYYAKNAECFHSNPKG